MDHYERHALDWDDDRNRQIAAWNDKPWHDRFVNELSAEATVLDLGCGSGSPVATSMADRGLRITGVDASPPLVSLCRQRLPDHEWLVGDVRLLRYPRRFDGGI
jgi:2-polyprenyl-3-methyl-5-hydroxy-6-metoxy-1,4-benzoquinol methylase